jgi:hypothetical protein
MTYSPNPKKDPDEPGRPRASKPSTSQAPSRPAEQGVEASCDRCGAEMFRMHAVWRCPRCGYKTDCCGW